MQPQPHLLGETLSSFHLLCCDKMLWRKHLKRDGLFGSHSQSTAHHCKKGKEIVIWRHLGTSLNFTSPAHSFQLGFQAHTQVPTLSEYLPPLHSDQLCFHPFPEPSQCVFSFIPLLPPWFLSFLFSFQTAPLPRGLQSPLKILQRGTQVDCLQSKYGCVAFHVALLLF